MNENQKEFLHRLRCLFSDYNIESAFIRDHQIRFKSNDEQLAFSLYENGVFYNVDAITDEFSFYRSYSEEDDEGD